MKVNFSLNKILKIAASAIIAIILIATAVLFASKKAVPAYGLRKNDPLPPSNNQTENSTSEQNGMPASENFDSNKIAAYTALGQLRTTTKSSEKKAGVPVVVSPWLAYPEGDKTFYEELDRKNRSIKATITGYFSRYTERELLTHGEIAIKTDLLGEINSLLVLGKISAIYFNEYIFLE